MIKKFAKYSQSKWVLAHSVSLIFVSTLIAAPVSAQTVSSGGPVLFSLFSLADDMGGHTPRGFRGQGAGIFVGDNLNPGFPNGDGVQAFISFDISELAAKDYQKATLFSPFLKVSGTPFEDLGKIVVEQIEFERFSSSLWDAPVETHVICDLAIAPDQTSASCDLSATVQAVLEEGKDQLQFRLQFESPSDNDGAPDLALFYKQNSNSNEGGVFQIDFR